MSQTMMAVRVGFQCSVREVRVDPPNGEGVRDWRWRVRSGEEAFFGRVVAHALRSAMVVSARRFLGRGLCMGVSVRWFEGL
jgi:hypothetical protein